MEKLFEYKQIKCFECNHVFTAYVEKPGPGNWKPVTTVECPSCNTGNTYYNYKEQKI